MAARLAERTKVWLLYVKLLRGDKGRLCRNIFQEICCFLHADSLLVRVTKSSFQFFDFQKGAWKQERLLNPTIQANLNSSWVLLEDGSVFVCGGESYSGLGGSTAYVIGDRQTQLADMQKARYWHGVLALHSNHAVYVFGGGML